MRRKAYIIPKVYNMRSIYHPSKGRISFHQKRSRKSFRDFFWWTCGARRVKPTAQCAVGSQSARRSYAPSGRHPSGFGPPSDNKKVTIERDCFGGDEGGLLLLLTRQIVLIMFCLVRSLGQPLKKRQVKALFLNALGSTPPVKCS